MHCNDLDGICYETEGIPYDYEKLKESTTIPPTTQDRLWATRLVETAKKLKTEHVTTLLEYSIRWKDMEIWRMPIKPRKLSALSRDLHNSWHTFSFDAVRSRCVKSAIQLG